MLRIIHTGDIHLDSPFSSLDPHRAEVRRQELRAAFTSLITYARTEKVSLMLIAGDLFDVEFVTRETLSLINSELSKLSCPVVISPGNHDPASEGSVWLRHTFPPNVFVFKDERLSSFDFPTLGVTVYGWAFTSRFMDASPLDAGGKVENPDRINILCAHGDITSPSSRSCPLTLPSLRSFGADYVALGHIHNPDEVGGAIMYCGCLEGRAFDEVGAKGAVDVTIADGEGGRRVTARRVKFSGRRYENGSLDVSGAESGNDIKERIASYISKCGYGSDVLLRLTLRGTVSPSFVPNISALESSPPRVFALKIIDKTSPILGADELRRDPTVRGEFYRVLEPMLSSADENEREVAADALRFGLAALAGESISDGSHDGGRE